MISTIPNRLHIYLIIFALACLQPAAFADTELIVPTSTGGDFDTGTYVDIDDPTIDDTDFISTDKQGESMTGTMSDLVTATGSDTFNHVIIHCRTDLTGTPGDEYFTCAIDDGTDTSTLTTGSNGTFTTDSSGNLTVHNSVAEINALTYNITAQKNAAENVDLWRCSEFWVEVDYTPSSFLQRILIISKNELNSIYNSIMKKRLQESHNIKFADLADNVLRVDLEKLWNLRDSSCIRKNWPKMNSSGYFDCRGITTNHING